MRKFLVIFLFMLVFSSVLGYGQFSGGSGTETDPYRITCREDLEALNDSLKSFYADYDPNDPYGLNFKQYNKHFKVMNNIADTVKTCIGDGKYPFSCTFDGNGYAITLNINVKEGYVGLFGSTRGATIKNVIVKGNIAIDSIAIVGGIAGYTRGSTIENCINMANIESNFGSAGGIVGSMMNLDNFGWTERYCINCINLGNIAKSNGGSSGIISNMLSAAITGCVNSGFVMGDCATGILNSEDVGIIYNSINTGVLLPLSFMSYPPKKRCAGGIELIRY